MATPSSADDSAGVRRAVAGRLLSALVREGLLDAARLPHSFRARQATRTGRLVLDAPDVAPADLLALAHLDGFHADSLRTLASDLDSAIVNLTDAARFRASHPEPPHDVLNWLRRRRREEPGFSALAWVEQATMEGHPLHPLGGVRVGFTDEERRAYAPEFRPSLRLGVVAVRHEHLHLAGSGTVLDDQQVIASAQAGLHRDGLDPARYALLPVHPWQVEHVIGPALTRGGDDRAAHPAVVCAQTIAASPLISLRTVVTRPDQPHLKLPIGVRSTGAVRRLSTHASRNGPAVSALLREILDGDPELRERGLDVLAETTGVHFVPPTGTPDLSADLAALTRQNPETAHELVVPVASLRAHIGRSGLPLVAEVLRENTGASMAQAATLFVRRYAQLLIPPSLTLLTRYGVALELHGQNTLVAVEKGLPTAVMARDLGSIRLHRGRLARHGLRPRLTPDAPIETDSDVELRAKLLYTLGHDHLGELLPCLAAVSGVDEVELWQPFADAVEATYARLTAEPDAHADAAAVRAEPWPLKALLRMRLRGATHEQSYVEGTNPLAAIR